MRPSTTEGDLGRQTGVKLRNVELSTVLKVLSWGLACRFLVGAFVTGDDSFSPITTLGHYMLVLRSRLMDLQAMLICLRLDTYHIL